MISKKKELKKNTSIVVPYISLLAECNKKEIVERLILIDSHEGSCYENELNTGVLCEDIEQSAYGKIA